MLFVNSRSINTSNDNKRLCDNKNIKLLSYLILLIAFGLFKNKYFHLIVILRLFVLLCCIHLIQLCPKAIIYKTFI